MPCPEAKLIADTQQVQVIVGNKYIPSRKRVISVGHKVL